MSTISNIQVPIVGPAERAGVAAARSNTAAESLREARDFGDKDELREKFTQFVGETFFGQMIKSMRSTVGKPAYFHGGQAEEAFRANSIRSWPST